MNKAQAAPSGFKAYVIVRDKYGRIVVDESIFHDKAKLDELRNEVLKNGSYACNRNP
jgi:hypothetical protein